jgi:hypothetical protein
MYTNEDFQVLQRLQDHRTTDDFLVSKREVPLLRMFCRDAVVFDGGLPTHKEWEEEDGTTMRCAIRVA